MPRKKKNNKVCIISDTHYGVRKGSQIFHDYYEKFYSETFFPTLDERGISTVIHLGDVFDVRKGIDYWSLDWSKRVVFQPLKDRNIETHIIIGNHDIFYKQSTKINSPALNLTEFTNVVVYSDPQTVKINGVELFVIPWICEENAEEFLKQRDESKALTAMGHLEIAGFYANKTYQVLHGMDAGVFSQFDRVFSGHFHKRNSSGNISYLGNPYQLYWNDEGETRGFHIYDLDTGELEFIPNPNTMFNKLYYNESESKLINPTKYKQSYVKIIVEGKSTPRKISRLIDDLYKAGCHDVKVVESVDLHSEVDLHIETEDTLTTLTKYINEMDDSINKENVIDIFKSLYVESQEV